MKFKPYEGQLVVVDWGDRPEDKHGVGFLDVMRKYRGTIQTVKGPIHNKEHLWHDEFDEWSEDGSGGVYSCSLEGVPHRWSSRWLKPYKTKTFNDDDSLFEV